MKKILLFTSIILLTFSVKVHAQITGVTTDSIDCFGGDANITVDVIGSNLSGTSYNINDGAFIDGIIMSYNTIVNFDIHISNLCY